MSEITSSRSNGCQRLIAQVIMTKVLEAKVFETRVGGSCS